MQSQVMQESATHSVEEERSRNGLVIERAIYGVLRVERLPHTAPDVSADADRAIDGDSSQFSRGARGVLHRMRSRCTHYWRAFSRWLLADRDDEELADGERSGGRSRRVEATSAHWRLHPSARQLLSGAPLPITSLIARPPAQATPASAFTTSEPSDNDNAGVVDVTTALRSLVRDSRLELPEGSRKSELIGFFDATPPFGLSEPGRRQRWLAIRYRWRAHEFEVLVGDREGLVLPRNPQDD